MPESRLPIRVYKEHDVWRVDCGEGELYSALPAYIRAAVVALSPIHVATTLETPVEIATAPRDTYFPAADARALVSALPHAQLTVTSLLTHATPRLSARYLAELRQLDGFFVRAIAAA